MVNLIRGTVNVAITGILDSLSHYHINEKDTGSNLKYFGRTDKDENWYIQRMDFAAEEYRYASGSGSFPTAWTNRASQVYNYFYVEF